MSIPEDVAISLSRCLAAEERADGIRVAVFRQVQDNAGGWQDAPVPAQAGNKIEDAILTRARQLRFDTLEQ